MDTPQNDMNNADGLGGNPDLDQAEQRIIDEFDATRLPSPDSDPVEDSTPAPEVQEHVDIPCAGCGRIYGFDIKPNTATFTFQCRACKTRTEWART